MCLFLFVLLKAMGESRLERIETPNASFEFPKLFWPNVDWTSSPTPRPTGNQQRQIPTMMTTVYNISRRARQSMTRLQPQSNIWIWNWISKSSDKIPRNSHPHIFNQNSTQLLYDDTFSTWRYNSAPRPFPTSGKDYKYLGLPVQLKIFENKLCLCQATISSKDILWRRHKQ